jgi:DNA-directed RNA polymerase specialized sigma24 family protein
MGNMTNVALRGERFMGPFTCLDLQDVTSEAWGEARRIARHIVRKNLWGMPESTIDDIAQGVCLDLLERLHDLPAGVSLLAVVARTARMDAIDELRHRVVQRDAESQIPHMAPLVGAEKAMESIMGLGGRGCWEAFVASSGGQDAIALALGATLDELEATTGVPRATIHDRVKRAQEELRACLEEEK